MRAAHERSHGDDEKIDVRANMTQLNTSFERKRKRTGDATKMQTGPSERTTHLQKTTRTTGKGKRTEDTRMAEEGGMSEIMGSIHICRSRDAYMYEHEGARGMRTCIHTALEHTYLSTRR